MHSAALLFAVTLLAACQKPETPEQMSARMSAESDSAKTAIEAANVRYARHMNSGHPDSIAMMFTDIAQGAIGQDDVAEGAKLHHQYSCGRPFRAARGGHG